MDDGTRTNSHTSENGAIGTDMNILADVNFSSYCSPATAFERFALCRRALRVNGHICTNRRIPADGDSSRVKKFARSSNVDIVANGEVVPVIAHERGVDVDAIAAEVTTRRLFARLAVRKGPLRYKNGPENVIARLGCNLLVRVVGVVETIDGTLAFLTLLDELWSERQERFAAQHLVFLTPVEYRRSWCIMIRWRASGSSGEWGE